MTDDPAADAAHAALTLALAAYGIPDPAPGRETDLVNMAVIAGMVGARDAPCPRCQSVQTLVANWVTYFTENRGFPVADMMLAAAADVRAIYDDRDEGDAPRQ